MFSFLEKKAMNSSMSSGSQFLILSCCLKLPSIDMNNVYLCLDYNQNISVVRVILGSHLFSSDSSTLNFNGMLKPGCGHAGHLSARQNWSFLGSTIP